MTPEGTKICLCRACGLLFTAITGFDAHREGPWEERRCLGAAALRRAGYRPDGRGRWGRTGGRVWPPQAA